ncbi:MAG: hypothetical protein GF401_05410 [Chitinivibrionales bacterium]|nr:hypothetical protein [Chitinivibrionales bacterium]
MNNTLKYHYPVFMYNSTLRCFAACSFIKDEKTIDFIADNLRPRENECSPKPCELSELNDGLVAYWSFDDLQNGITVDSSGSSLTV